MSKILDEADLATAPAGVQPNGTVWAAFLAAAIGSFAVGLFVVLDEAGVYSAPSLYGPAGGVSGRTTFAVVVWLLSWGVLHKRWSGRHLVGARLTAWIAILVGIGIIATIPLVWRVF